MATFLVGFRPECWPGSDASRLVDTLARLARLTEAAMTLAVGRVAACDAWKRAGHATVEEWLASTSGTAVGAAGERLRTARQLDDLPVVADALRQGRLSGPQTSLVAAGATADPSEAQRLIDAAGVDPLHQLRRKVRHVRAAARHGQVDTRAIHATRTLRTWTADDGALEGRFRLTPDRGAQFLAALEPFRTLAFDAARTSGISDDPACHAADGLVDMALAARPDRDTTSVTAQIAVRVDRAALLRGWTEPGETCEIDGIGAVPVTVASRLAGDAVLWAVLTDGDRLIDVRHAGRALPARLKIGLIERDPACVVPGCGRTHRLEIHHLHPYALGGVGSLDNLARVCLHHHDLLTHRGARLDGPWPNWTWTPPPVGPDGEEGGPGPFDDPPPDVPCPADSSAAPGHPAPIDPPHGDLRTHNSRSANSPAHDPGITSAPPAAGLFDLPAGPGPSP